MARKVADVLIDDEGRDFHKTFQITEMSAVQAEKWALRALRAAASGGADVGAALGLGMQGIAVLGIQALFTMPFEEADPLLDELMTCVKIKPSHNVVRDLIDDDDIEEVSTRLKLKMEVVKLHINFSTAGAASKSTSETSATESTSSSTPTSPDPSVRFSRPPRTKQHR